ncbi:MAG: endonuclease/exonuclease/phosphatase family protein [Emcibacter sp.]|nr:endonuclease/exonuclease/phosphatase family protein [Emcibacter sp.]
MLSFRLLSILTFLVSNHISAVYAADELVILTINLHTYQELRQEGDTPQQRIERNQPLLATVAQAIADLDADLVCLQEVGEWRGDVRNPETAPFGKGQSNAANKINRLLGGRYNIHMDWSHYGWDIWREGVAIFSKTPFRETESRFVTKDQSHQFWKSRNIARAETEVKGIGKIDIFSVHTGWWDDKKEPFQAQFSNIMKWAEEVRVNNKPDAIILCGDFNIEAGSPAYHFVTKNFGYNDLYYQANPAGLMDATIDGKRIDYILMNEGSPLEVTAAQRIFTKKDYGRVSDHKGIYVRISPKK